MQKTKQTIFVAMGFLAGSFSLLSAQNGKVILTKENGIELSSMDKSVRAGDDFYNYVNGGWMKTAKIPSDKSYWGSFSQLAETTDNNCLQLLKQVLKEKFSAGSEGQKIQDLYGSYIDLSLRNKQGITPIKADLQAIDQIQNMHDLQNYLVEATKKDENPFYGWGVGADLKDSRNNAVYLGDISLGLGRDYYQKQSEQNSTTIAEYTKYVASLLDILGIKDTQVVAGQIADFEKSIAKTLLTNEQVRDSNLQYNPKTMAELSAMVKNVNLPAYLSAVGVHTDKVIVGELKYYQALDGIFVPQNLPLLKNFLKYKLLASNTGNLDEKLDTLHFDFYNKYLRGQKEQRALDKRGLSLVNGILGEAFGKLYVEKYFPAEAKEQMVTLIDYLKKSFAVHIENLSWMSPETRVKALEKLHKFTVKIAYPDKWKDYSALQLKSIQQGGSLYDNLQRVSLWSYQRELDKIRKPVDKSEWGMTPQTVNAYYNPSNNEIVFPAAILQTPFFNFKADPAVNFGGIGAVIGHEMSHGFDDSGADFDGDGNLKNWWTDQDKLNFEKSTKSLAKQYDGYYVSKDAHVNGTFTNGENIADLGGVNIAFDALQMYLKDHGQIAKISGFTQDQRFFMSWATVWRTLATDKFTQNLVKTDPHSPGYFRSFGPLVNTDAFYKAFDVKKGDKLYKTPQERIKIW